MSSTPPKVGILALQGAYAAHERALREVGANPLFVRLPAQLAQVDALVIPGGESTTFLKHLARDGFFDVLNDFVRQKPVFGTCAGTILLAREVVNPLQSSLGATDITVERNAYGRQLNSSIETLPTTFTADPIEMVFIRAPRILRTGPAVQVLAQRDGFPVLTRQANVLTSTFHPELGDDRRIHQLFLQMIPTSQR